MNKALKTYQEKLIAFFESTRKAGWRKNELISQLKNLYIEYLESVISTPTDWSTNVQAPATIRNNSDQ